MMKNFESNYYDDAARLACYSFIGVLNGLLLPLTSPGIIASRYISGNIPKSDADNGLFRGLYGDWKMSSPMKKIEAAFAVSATTLACAAEIAGFAYATYRGHPEILALPLLTNAYTFRRNDLNPTWPA